MAYNLNPRDVPRAKRRLAAILSADVKGYSRLMGADELGTHKTLKAHREVMDELILCHGGRVVGTAGDSVLADFPSVVEALSAAVDIQRALHERNEKLPPDRRLEFRIGINLGDVIVDGDDIYGDGVNVAARLQAIGEAGGITISGGVYDQVKNKLDLGFRDRGTQRVKNIADPVRVYSVEPGGGRLRVLKKTRRWWLPALAASLVLVAVGIAVLQSAIWSPRDSPWFETAIAALDLARNMIEPASQLDVASKPAIAVLPFANQSETGNDYFSDGITEELIAALSRFSNLTVMSWNAVASYKDQPVKPEQLARDLAVRYVVEGSVRRADERMRITARLTDAESGSVLWSKRYDETVDDIFAVQDDITRRIVAALAIKVTDLEQQRAFTKPTENLSAYDYFLRGREHYRPYTRAGNLRAREAFETAIDFDPTYADAYAMLGWTHLKAAEHGWTEWPHKALERAHDLAQTALRSDPSNVRAHALLANAYAYNHDYERALREIDRVFELNPSYAEHHADLSWVMLLAGRLDEAIEVLEEALRFDPNPVPAMYANLAIAYYLEGRYEDAIATLRDVISRQPHHIPSHIVLAAAYAQAGRTEDAARAAENVRRVHPFFDVELYGDAFREAADREHLREGLRKAGLQ